SWGVATPNIRAGPENMIRRVCLLLLFGALTEPAGAFQNGEWVKVSPIGAGFTAMMPAKPEEEIKPGSDLTLHQFSAQTPNAIYMVAYGDYAPTLRLDVAVELTSNRDSFVKGIHATLTNTRNITLNGHQGIEFTAETDQASFKSRVYIFGNRMHQLVVAVF